MPPGPVTPLASLVHAKGNPHVFLDLEVRCEPGGSFVLELHGDFNKMVGYFHDENHGRRVKT